MLEVPLILAVAVAISLYVSVSYSPAPGAELWNQVKNVSFDAPGVDTFVAYGYGMGTSNAVCVIRGARILHVFDHGSSSPSASVNLKVPLQHAMELQQLCPAAQPQPRRHRFRRQHCYDEEVGVNWRNRRTLWCIFLPEHAPTARCALTSGLPRRLRWAR